MSNESTVKLPPLPKPESKGWIYTSDQMISYARAAIKVALASPKALPAPERITITLRQAERLVAFFGGHDCEVTVEKSEGSLIAWCTEYPEDGAENLGATEIDDELAANGRDVTPIADAPREKSVAESQIDLRYHATMNALAEGIDEVLGGLGFALLVFELNKVEGGRVNYISNAKREDMLAAMREFVARAEGRVHESPKEPQ